MKILKLLLALIAFAPASHADILVNLDATNKPTGDFATWPNAGTLGGNFTSAGVTIPKVVTVALPLGGSVNAVRLVNAFTHYQGPAAPVSLTANNSPRTVEAWVLNPVVASEETIFAWGRRGADGLNSSFNYGSNTVFGAVGHFGSSYDVGWGTTPTAAIWHHLVYTYDGTTARLYVDGVERNSRAVALNTAAVSTGGGALPFRVGAQNEASGAVNTTGAASLDVGRIRVRNELLTLSQIQSIYASEGPVFGRAEPSVGSFAASSTATLPGQSVTLSWNLVNATSASINQGIGTVSPTSGTVVVSPLATTTYTITASNAAGSANASVTITPLSAIQLRNRWSFSNAAGAATNGAQVNDSVGTAHGFIRGTGATFTGAQASLPGGASGSAPYIDLPNGVISTLNEATIEGWMTLNGPQNWSRCFDFGVGSANELTGPGGAANGVDVLLLAAQVGGDTAQRRLAMMDAGVEQGVNFPDATTFGAQFHFAVVYKVSGAGGVVSYFKNGTLVGQLNTSYRLQSINDVNNWLGRSNWTGDANTQGSYNEFRIWNGALPQSAIADATAAGPDLLPQFPRVDAFATAGNSTLYRGETARLSYVLADPASLGITASINQGVGTVTTPTGFVDVSPSATTTYTLTVVNSAGSRTATTTVNVLPSEPVANNLAVQVNYETPTPITLTASDPNTPTGSLTYTVVSAPVNGVLSGSGSTRTYTPNAGFFGADTFTFLANDGTSNSNLGTVSVTILPPPAPPTDIVPNDTSIRTTAVNGSFIANLRPIDPNPTDTFTLALVSGTGDTHNGFFTLNGTQLISNRDFSGDLGLTISIRVRVTDNTGRTFEKVLTFPVLAPDLHVKINEVHYNPARNTMRTEFIELYNPTPASVDLSGWRFNSGVDYVFPAGTTIAPGAYLVVASHPPTMAAFYGVTALGPWTGGLDSLGEEIVLRDAAGNRVDGVDYGITAPWPATPNGDGPTLELVHPSLDNDHGSNWRASNAAPTVINYLAAGSTGWRYRKGTSEASSPMGAWHAENFTLDGTWLTGTAPIGVYYQNSATPLAANAETGVTLATQLTDMATFSGGTFTVNYRSVYFRKTFNVSGAIPKQLLLRVQHNDAAIVWINGIEITRFGFPPTSTGDAAFNSTAVYERGNDPWSEVVIANADSLLHSGTNTIAIHGLSKAPQTRADQEDFGNYNVFDFSVDAALTHVPETLGTPGAQNSVLSATSGPVIRSIGHSPKAPVSTQPVTLTARVSDPQGVGAVNLSYQIVAPGNFIPSTLPLTNAQILANPLQSLPANPAFELAANWTTIPMVDNGSVAGDVVGDGIYTAIIPAQPHRTLVRYRISANDLTSLNTRVPATNDPRKNFAFFVYDGVPAYVAGNSSFSPSTLNTLPAYHWLTRAADFSNLLAYNGAEQFANTPALADLNARRFENFEGALVVGDQVVDHTLIRLRGGNSRYNGTGKRHFRFVFPKGTPFQAADEAGREYPRPWEDMLFNKLFGNKGYYDFGLPYEIGGKMWSLSGVPIPESHWVHFRVIRDADQSHATLGDFWGLYQALELPDGANFLKARNLERGNFYKMSDWMQNGEMSQRSQAPLGVDFAEDFDNIRYNIHQTASDAYLEQYVNMPLYYKYDAVKEAIRHYDIFVEPTGRHRVKNLIWYFQPVDGNPLGKLWHMPYDWDASFGPNWNQGWDLIHNAIYDRFDIVDSPTWALPKQTPRTAISIAHRNAIRELRDLLVYRDTGTGRGPVDDIMDDAAAKLAAFYPADIARWPAPGAAANYPGGVPSKIADMKAFLFTGWTDTSGSGDPAVGAGGRAAYLDTISDGVDAGLLPAKPAISNSSVAGNPIDGIALTSSAFSDPQGTVTFGGMQWRIGEVTDPAAPAYDPAAERIYEMTEVWSSGELATFNATITVPANVLKVGRSYRARVRHKDSTGRYGHWSEPVSFITAGANYSQILRDNLLITEVMYHPAPVSLPAEFGRVEEDFEFIELQNISPTLTLDLGNVNFDRGVDFDFFGSSITSLAPGQRVLVVANVAAFESRYGTGKPIAGTWESGDLLSNAGERLRLVFGVSDVIHDFTYDDVAPWPAGADVGGYSMVLINPGTHGPLTAGTSWRAGMRFGGTAGENGTVFSEWAALRGVSAPLGDDDKDGIVNQLEYAFGGVPTISDQSPMPARTIQSVTVSGVPANYFTLTFRRVTVAEDLAYSVEFTSDLGTSWSANGGLVSSATQPDGSVLETWRAAIPATPGTKHFGRVKVVRP